jgi:hypothetical protein
MAGWLTQMFFAARLKAAGLRHGPKKGKVVEVHRARQHDTAIFDEELLSVQTSGGTEMSSTGVTSSFMGICLESVMRGMLGSPRAILLS